MGVYFYPHLFDVGAFRAECTADDLARLDRIAAVATIETRADGLGEEDRALADTMIAAVASAEVELGDDARIFSGWEGTWDLFGRVAGELPDGDELGAVLGGAHRLWFTESGIEGFLLPDEIGRAVELLRARGAGDDDSVALLDMLETAAGSGHGLAWWWV